MYRIDEIRPGVAMIIFDSRGHVLLQKRADVGLWGIPSGRVEPGETVVNAAVREVREETGLETRVVRLIGVYSEPESQVFTYPTGRSVHFVTLCFEMKVVGGQLSNASPETLDVRYFSPDELPSDMLPMHPRWLSDAIAKAREPFIR
ncbi:NUDIX domain-containing protein [Alicyclobacillus sendaiensis]|uniref:NUDIX domain-containing protein n=1 Tax=Alicyclobacillus sendaiensis TaxID=192387 RepID=UPI000780ECB5|nr:NUDIX domain-containing protein [Alicyclobacillus sendaiensis]